jgi:hypothetical protein
MRSPLTPGIGIAGASRSLGGDTAVAPITGPTPETRSERAVQNRTAGGNQFGQGRQAIPRPPTAIGTLNGRAGGAPTHHLNQIDLSRRWRISPRTLERWRWLNQGPAYLKIGGRVVYRLEDVEAYEATQRR